MRIVKVLLGPGLAAHLSARGPVAVGAMPIKDVKKRLSATLERSFARRSSRDEAPVEDKCKMGWTGACTLLSRSKRVFRLFTGEKGDLRLAAVLMLRLRCISRPLSGEAIQTYEQCRVPFACMLHVGAVLQFNVLWTVYVTH